MRITLLFFLIFICTNAQNQKLGIVLDAEDLKPIEFVDVFNNYDSTLTNEDGRFFFLSSRDSIIFSKLGYNRLKTTFNQTSDTILLNKKVIALDGVTVIRTDSLWQKVKRNVAKNYSLHPYNEKFFLRSTLKLNDSLVRIQDMQGQLHRKTLLYSQGLELTKKDYEIELTNMRKVGVATDKNKVYFRFPTFYGLLSNFVRLNATGPDFKLKELPFLNEAKTRYEFLFENEHQVTKGHYIINTNTYAIVECHLSVTTKNIPYSKDKWLHYRTNKHIVKVIFDFDKTEKKYYIKNAILTQEVECTNEEKSFKEVYESRFVMDTYDNFGDFKVKKNISAVKDIFKIKYKYDSNYWEEQNQLLLTNEMVAFIKRMGTKNKEYKIRSNIK